jgi:hypothetical protein
MSILQTDSKYLMSLLASLVSDKMHTGETFSIDTRNFSLKKDELCNLCRKSGLLNRLVYSYPMSAAESWVKLEFSSDKKSSVKKSEEILKYMGTIPYYTSVSGKEKAGKGVRNAFRFASGLARKLGSASILMLCEDFEDLDQPINISNLDGIQALKIYDCYECVRDFLSTDKDVYYQVSGLASQKIHSSRILSFYGNRLDTYDEYCLSFKRHDSCIYALFDAFCNWLVGGKAIADMLKTANAYKLGIADLGQSLKEDTATNSHDTGDHLLSRMISVRENLSINSILAYDLTEEAVETVARNLSGTKDSYEALENLLVANSDMPRWKLLNQFGTAGLASSIESARILQYNWAILVSEWSNFQWREPLSYIIELIMYSFYGKILKEYNENSLIFPLQLKLDDFEQINLEKMAAERNEILIRNNIITNLEARNSYQSAVFNPVITLIESEVLPTPNVEETRNANI